MPSNNRSPLGFGPILLFHICILASGVMLQNLAAARPQLFLFALGVVLVGGAVGAFFARRFLWDVFRNFKSAAVILSLLVLSCVLGTMFIQDLDLRRDGVFFDPARDFPRDADGKGVVPPFDDKRASTRFALAESSFLLWLSPDEQRQRLLEEKVKLSDTEKEFARQTAEAFGERASETYMGQVLRSKRRNVEQLTTSLYAKRNFSTIHKYFFYVRQFRLFDIFESWWFYMLLGLLAINVTIGTIARAPWNVRDIGVAITHAGILTILTGALWDRLEAQEGYIYFKYSGRPEDQIQSKMEDRKNQLYTYLPFRVRMERFATEYYHELLVRRIDWTKRHDGSAWDTEAVGGSPFHVWKQIPIRENVRHVLDQGDIDVIVTRYRRRVRVFTDVDDVPGGTLSPGLKLGLYPDPGRSRNYFVHLNRDPWLFALDGERASFEFFRGHLQYMWARNKSEYANLLATPPVPDNGTLVLRRGEETIEVPVTLGRSERISVGPKVLNIQFLDIRSALSDDENVNLDRNLQRREEPVLMLMVDGHRVMVPRDDREFFKEENLLGVSFRFAWPDPSDSGVHAIYRVVEGDGLPRVLVQAGDEGGPLVERMSRNRTVALHGPLRGAYLGVEKWVRSAREGRKVVDVTDEEFLESGGGAQDHLLAASMDITIRDTKGRWKTIEQKDVTPYSRPIFFGRDAHGRPYYEFRLIRTGQALDWFSVLSAIDSKGNVLKSHTVQVNSPLRYQGYRFYQATAGRDGDGFGISGISVTKQPGVIYMYWGYAILTFGVCYIFFFKPILVSRQRKRRRREVAA